MKKEPKKKNKSKLNLVAFLMVCLLLAILFYIGYNSVEKWPDRVLSFFVKNRVSIEVVLGILFCERAILSLFYKSARKWEVIVLFIIFGMMFLVISEKVEREQYVRSAKHALGGHISDTLSDPGGYKY